MTSNTQKAPHMPTHVLIHPDIENGLRQDSIVLAEQVSTIHKSALLTWIGHLDSPTLRMVGQARCIQSPFQNA